MKVGDQVAVEYGHTWNSEIKYELRTVTKVTNTQIVLDDGHRFYKGSYKRWGAPVGITSRIVQITSEIASEVARGHGIEFLRQMDWDLLHNDKLLEIITIINKELK